MCVFPCLVYLNKKGADGNDSSERGKEYVCFISGKCINTYYSNPCRVPQKLIVKEKRNRA